VACKDNLDRRSSDGSQTATAQHATFSDHGGHIKGIVQAMFVRTEADEYIRNVRHVLQISADRGNFLKPARNDLKHANAIASGQACGPDKWAKIHALQDDYMLWSVFGSSSAWHLGISLKTTPIFRSGHLRGSCDTKRMSRKPKRNVMHCRIASEQAK
jgi:hypothetical protein